MTRKKNLSEQRRRWRSIEETLDGVLALPTDERAAYLDRVCGHDPELREAVDSLLAEEDGEQTRTRSSDPVDPGLAAGNRIGNYRLIRSLGEGGMGEVFEAEQERPVHRRVALKVIKQGMDTRRVIARFEAERQALALMDHPNIARVLDAGATDRGRPFFVMELVKGTPIDEHCDRNLLTTRERLELFEQVCEGVQHAHQKAVIHRDLKPSNVLVVEQDGKRTPKIIDFGVAKATAHRLTEKTLYTELGAMVGTPAYMSPEQAAADAADIDTRTDVYSLGVLLYKLLVGALPFDPKELREAGYDAIRRKILEEEPSRPSTRLTTLGESATDSARKRRVDRSTLRRQLEGDLDWITMRALEKDRSRRYGSPSELAADIRRHLDNEPVAASPPSVAYRARKFVRRHRTGVTVAVAAAVVVLGAAALLAVQNRRIAAERDRANLERQVSERVSETLAEVLGSADPAVMGGALWSDLRERVASTHGARGASESERAAVLASFEHALADVNPTDVAQRLMDEQLLSHAARTTARMLDEDPTIASRLEGALDGSYRKLGLYDKAETHALRALELNEEHLGADHERTIGSRLDLASVYLLQGRLDECEPLVLAANEDATRVFGDEHAVTARAKNALASLRLAQSRFDETVPLAAEAIDIYRRTLGDDHRETMFAMNNHVQGYAGMGKYDEAEPLALELLDARRRAFGENHRDTLWSRHHLAGLYVRMGRYDEAESIGLANLETRRAVLGEDHPDTLWSMALMAWVYNEQGRAEESERVGLDVLERRRRTLGQVHPDTLRAMNTLANTYWYQERLSDAEPLYREAYEIRKRTLGASHQDTLTSMGNLALAYSRLRRRAEAERLYLEAVTTLEGELGSTHPATVNVKQNLGILYRDQGRFDEAEPLLIAVHRARTNSLGEDHKDTIVAGFTLGDLYRRQGRHDEASARGTESLDRARQNLGPEHPSTLGALSLLFFTERDRGRFDEAEAFAVERFETVRKTKGDRDPVTLLWQADLADVWRRQGRHDEAEEELREVLNRLSELPQRGNRKTALYYLGCLHAARGEPSAALDLLTEAVDAGFTNRSDLRGIVEDPALRSLRGQPRFDALVAKVRRRIAADG